MIQVQRLYSAVLLVILGLSTLALPSVVPNFIRYGGAVPGVTGQVSMIFEIFEQESGGVPLWVETQELVLDSRGRFTALLGATSGEGVPIEIFRSGAARWLSVTVVGHSPRPRSLLVSVPYALKAEEAERLSSQAEFEISELVTTAVGRELSKGTSTVARLASSGAPTPATSAVLATAATYTESNASEVLLVQQTGAGYAIRAIGGQSAALWAESSGTSYGAIAATATSDTQSANAVYGQTFGPGGVGIWGRSLSSTGGGIGIRGDAAGSGAVGLYGVSTAKTGSGTGLLGESEGDGGFGIRGAAYSPTGKTYGILGSSASSEGIGLRGNATSTSGQTTGVYATVFSPQGTAAVFENAAGGKLFSGQVNGTERFSIDGAGNLVTNGNVISNGRVGIGTKNPGAALDVVGEIKTSGVIFPDGTVQRSATGDGNPPITPADGSLIITPTGQISIAPNGIDSFKLADNSVTTSKIADGSITPSKLNSALFGSITSGANQFHGPQTIQVAQADAYAVLGKIAGVSGSGHGVLGETEGDGGSGVSGTANNANGTAIGVRGISAASSGTGVYGENSHISGSTQGVVGVSRSSAGTGVSGKNTSKMGTTYGVYGTTASDQGSAGVYGSATKNISTGTTQYGVYGTAAGPAGVSVAGFSTSTTGMPVGVWGRVNAPSGMAAHFINGASGTADIIVASSGTRKVWRVDTNGDTWANGISHVGGADFAEEITPSPTANEYGPGDVMVIADDRDRAVTLSCEPYSRGVIGVYATQPGVLASRNLGDGAPSIPVSMIGIVPVKASAENGPIHRGDLLVTSNTPGHVMKATDTQRMLGAIVGKAMSELELGTGVIEIAVTLQ